MWRRTFITLPALWSSALLACSSRKAGAPTRIESIVERENLVLIGSRDAPGTTSPYAFSATGSIIGALGRIDQPYVRAVSPDGEWIAWVPARTEQPTVLFMSNPCCVQTLAFDIRYVRALAISSKPQYVALVAVVEGSMNHQLLLVHPETGKVKHDLTDLVHRLNLAKIERLGISGRRTRFDARAARVVCRNRCSLSKAFDRVGGTLPITFS